MIDCVGCKRQQMGSDALCLACIEDLALWLRSIPDLYAELGSVRLPGSVRASGPSTKSSSVHSPAPVRLEVVDLLDRGEVFKRLEPWSYGATVREMCDRLRSQLLSVAIWDREDASQFYRQMKGLCRDLGRAVGEPEEAKPVGKCSRPLEEGLCRGQLHRAAAGGVYCRRCGDKPELIQQPAWVSLRQAAEVVGKPIETIRTWYKRGRLNWGPAQWLDHSQASHWSDPIGPPPAGMAWLPAAARLANESATTLPHSSDTVNHESVAELSPIDRNQAATTAAARQMISEIGARSVSDADVLGRLVTGNVTPSLDASSGTDVASDSNGAAPEQGPLTVSSERGKDPSTAAVPPTESTSAAGEGRAPAVGGVTQPCGAAGARGEGPDADHLSASGPHP